MKHEKTIRKTLLAKRKDEIPEGYKMMPFEPTEEVLAAMASVGYDQYDGDENYCGTTYDMADVYEAALIKAPEHEAQTKATLIVRGYDVWPDWKKEAMNALISAHESDPLLEAHLKRKADEAS